MTIEESHKLRCYISAPFGTDLTLIKDILKEKKIITTNQGMVGTGEPIINTVKKAIENSNFICGIIPREIGSENIFFDIGMAYAINKPIILLFDSNIDIPIFLNNLSYVKVNFKNESSIKLALNSFIDYGLPNYNTNKKYYHEIKKQFDQNLVTNFFYEFNERRIYEVDVNHFLEKLLKEAGYTVETKYNIKSENKLYRPDIAVWIEELQNIFKNPILIEIKRITTDKNLLDTEIQLTNYLKIIEGNIGIIVYYGAQDIKYPYVAQDIVIKPLIVSFNIYEFVDLIKNHNLENKLTVIRNQVAHGGL